VAVRKRLSRRTFLTSSVSAAALSAMSAEMRAADANERPNILWLVSEDNFPFIGAYGDARARTPAIDALAKAGVRYANAFSNAPVCAPSRFAIITGMHAESCGPAHHMRAQGKVPSFVQGFPKYLRDAGYYCANNGKTDYNAELDMAAMWDDASERAHWRNRPEHAPFFAVFNLMTTHESQMFAAVDGRVKSTDVRVPAYLPDVPATRRDIASYHNLMERMDAEVAAHLAALDDADLADDTIVFYYSDNGGVLPRSKRYCYDQGLRVAMVARFPARWAHLAPGAPGAPGATGATGATGGTGATGPAGPLGVPYTFNSTTTDSDPGPGLLRLNNATQNASDRIRVDLIDAAGADATAWLQSFSPQLVAAGIRTEAIVKIVGAANPSNWLLFHVSGYFANSGYRNLFAKLVDSSGANPFSNGDPLLVFASPYREFTSGVAQVINVTPGGGSAAGGVYLEGDLGINAKTDHITFNVQADGDVIIASFPDAHGRRLTVSKSNTGTARRVAFSQFSTLEPTSAKRFAIPRETSSLVIARPVETREFVNLVPSGGARVWVLTNGQGARENYLDNAVGDVPMHDGKEYVKTNAGALIMAERAAGLTLAAGQGQFFPKNDTPNNPYFRDDTNVDRKILTAPLALSDIATIPQGTALGRTALSGNGVPGALTGLQQGENLRRASFVTDALTTGVVATYTITETTTQVLFTGSGTITLHGATIIAGKPIDWGVEQGASVVVTFINDGSPTITQERFRTPNGQPLSIRAGEHLTTVHYFNRHRIVGVSKRIDPELVAPVANQTALEVVFPIVLTPGGSPGSPDDVTLWNANAPWAFEVMRITGRITTALAGTVEGRSASGGGGVALTDTLSTAALGPAAITAGLASIATVALNGSFYIRRTDQGVGGKVYVHAIRT
jgi:hypothetical protein